MGRPNTVVTVSAAESEQLGAIARSRSLPHSLVRRARIVLMSAGSPMGLLPSAAGSAFRPSTIGGAAGVNAGWRGYMGNCVRDVRAVTTTSKWRR